MDIAKIRDGAVTSVAGGLAQVKHLRFHGKDQLGVKAKKTLDTMLPNIQKILESLISLDLTK